MDKEVLIKRIEQFYDKEEVESILSDIVTLLITSDFGYVKQLGPKEVVIYLINEGIDITSLENLESDEDTSEFFDNILFDKINRINSLGMKSQIDYLIESGISAENIQLMITKY